VRIVGLKDIDAFCARRRSAEPDLRALLAMMLHAEWSNMSDVKRQFGEIASVIAPDQVRLELAKHGIAIDLNLNFRVGLVRLRLADLKSSKEMPRRTR